MNLLIISFLLFLIIIISFILSKKNIIETIVFNTPYMKKEYKKQNITYNSKKKQFIKNSTNEIASSQNQFNSKKARYISNQKDLTNLILINITYLFQNFIYGILN